MKYLVVGLGNIGAEYAATRHNVGFLVVDALVARKSGEASTTQFKTDRLGDVAQIKVKGHTLILLKPSTYMNLSGRAVAYWMQKEKIDPANLLIVVDDIAFDFGILRMRAKGSDGGHNGLKSINGVLGTDVYTRLRVGVGGGFARGHQVDYVLGEWTAEEREKLPEILASACDGVELYALQGTERAMNIVNTKK